MIDKAWQQHILPDERFREWFTQLDFPKPGQDSIVPMLLVASLPKNEREPLEITPIALAVGNEFNDARQKFKIMSMIGARCSDEGMQPVAIALLSEVWTRHFTPEEGKTRGKRQVSDYEDRDEEIMLCGATIDGRAALIKAPILRGEGGVITGYGPRMSSLDNSEITEIEPSMLMQFFKGFLLRKFGAPPRH